MPVPWVYIFIFFIILFTGLYLYLVIRHRDKVKLVNLAAWIALGIAFFMVIHIITLMIYPAKIQEVTYPMTITNQNKEVKRGEYVGIRYHIIKYVSSPSTIYPSILCDDGTYFTFPERVSNVPKGEGTYTVPQTVVIPDTAPLNTECILRGTDIFQLNVLRKKIFINETEKFKVVE